MKPEGAKRRVLILSVGHGSGYLRSAEAVVHALEEADSGLNVMLVDYFERFTSATSAGASIAAYRASALSTPLRKRGGRSRPSFLLNPGSFITDHIRIPGRSQFMEFVREFSPDAIVANFSITAEATALLKREGIDHILTAVVVTEFFLVSSWIHPELDLYFTPTSDVADLLRENGVEDERIVVSGIPVPEEYVSDFDHDELLAKYRIVEDEPVILVAAETLRDRWIIIQVDDVFKGIVGKFHVIYAVGDDARLVEDLKGVVRNDRYRATIIEGEVHMDELMDVAELLVGGVDAIVATEALLKGLPMVAYKPVTIEAVENARFLREAGVMTVASDTAELWRTVTDFLEGKRSMNFSSEAATGLAHPDAARIMAERIDRELSAGREYYDG